MEIKILVPENRESDLDNFIKTCEDKGFELQNRGGGHMPNFSGYYATLKGSRWKEIPYPTAQLKEDKEELIENHLKLFRRLNSLVNRYKLGGFEDLLEKSREINRKHSEGGLNIVQSNP